VAAWGCRRCYVAEIEITTPEIPLHIQVATVLGWSAFLSKHGHFIVTHGIDPTGGAVEGASCEWAFGYYHNYEYDPHTGKKLPTRTIWWEDCPHIPVFDTDWAAGGPLIARLHIELAPRWDTAADQDTPPSVWDAMSADRRFQGSSPSSPLEAVCNLIVAMRAGGVDVARKLKRGR
jgi:hypothetical protein